MKTDMGEKSVSVTESEHPTIGVVCNIRKEDLQDERTVKWKHRVVALAQVLYRQSIRLFVYSYAQIDASTDCVKGYVIENDRFVMREGPVPRINYNYFSGSWQRRHPNARDFDDLMEWADTNGVQFFPHRNFIRASVDKFHSHQLVKGFDETLVPDTEKYTGELDQLERFLVKYDTIFLKPRWGNRGRGIVVLRTISSGYKVSHWDGSALLTHETRSLDTLKERAEELMGNVPAILQQGIPIKRIDGRVFDIRVIMVDHDDEWQWFHTVRLGGRESDVSNLAQGGSLLSLHLFLESHFPDDAQRIYRTLRQTSDGLARYLDAFMPGQLMEVAFDYLLSARNTLFLAEINTKPGMRVPHRFKNVFRRSPAEENLFTEVVLPHAKALAGFLTARLAACAERTPSVWFAELVGAKPVRSFRDTYPAAIVDCVRRQLFPDEQPLPQQVVMIPGQKHGFIVFLGLQDRHGNRSESCGSGVSIELAVKEAAKRIPERYAVHFQPSMVDVEIVTTVRRLQESITQPLPVDTDCEGVACSADIGLAFTATQLREQHLISARGKLRLLTMRRFFRWHPHCFRQYRKMRAMKSVPLFSFRTEKIRLDLDRDHHPPTIGFMCGSGDVMGLGRRMGLSRLYRATAMSDVLRDHGTRLLLYSPMQVNQATGDVDGYYLDGREFIAVRTKIPQINGCWYFGGSPEQQKQRFKTFQRYTDERGIQVFAPWAFRRLLKNKWRTYKTLLPFAETLMPKTALFQNQAAQVESFLEQGARLFLKPNKGSRGKGIITLSKHQKTYQVVVYGKPAPERFESPSLYVLLERIKKYTLSRTYVIQRAIDVPLYNDAGFDIRVIVLNDGNQFHCLHYARVGVQGSELSYTPRQSREHESQVVLETIYGKQRARELTAEVEKVGIRLAGYLERFFPGSVMEVAFDFLLDAGGHIFLAEANATPGLWYDEPYTDVFALTAAERKRFARQIAPHGRCLASFLQAKLDLMREGELKDQRE
ncbi:YheC/YheD family protein [Desulfofustis limnaeus]|nr:YheC/YheD family protein [Desulfofustis limnaeus]